MCVEYIYSYIKYAYDILFNSSVRMRAFWHCLHVRVEIDNTKVIKAVASVAGSYNLQSSHSTGHMESKRKISSSDTRAGHMAAQNFVEFIGCYRSFGLWRFAPRFSVDSSSTPTRNDIEELFIDSTHINTLIMTVLMIV